MGKDMEVGLWSTKMAGNMRGSGTLMWEMGEALRDIPMVIIIMGISRMEKLMAREFTHGQMGKFMMENGIKASSTAMEFGKGFLATLTLENGVGLRLRDMVFTIGNQVIDMRENGNNALNMDREQIYLLMEMYILANTKKANLMVKGSIHGGMAKFILESLRLAWNMVKGNGKAGRAHNAIHMRVIMHMTRNLAMVFFSGQAAIVIRENIKMMNGMVMEKWSGLMAACIKENGIEEFSMGRGKWYFQMGPLKRVISKIMCIEENKKFNHLHKMT
jgi:hypothetical protein